MGEGREQRTPGKLLKAYMQHVERHRLAEVGDVGGRLVVELPETKVNARLREASPARATVTVGAAGKTAGGRLRLV